VNNKVKS